MLIAVTGEGPTDYGKRNYQTREWEEGPILQYMRNIAAEIGEEPLIFCVIEKEVVNNIRIQRRSMQGLHGHALPARRFAICMRESGISKGVYYCDADRESGARNTEMAARKRFLEVYQEVQEGLRGVEAIPMVALRMIECWILGDIVAIEEAMEISVPKREIPNEPEFLWGDKNDPNSNYPKNYLKRIIRNADARLKNFEGNREDFVEIAKHSESLVMRSKCPISYERFYDDFMGLLNKA